MLATPPHRTSPVAREAPTLSAPAANPSGYLTFTLHAHLPYVVNHGTWPHGMEWLHEAAAETYLPLLRMFRRLERDGLRLPCNLNLSPILLEQLAHPVFRAEFPNYLERKITAAREDEAYFVSAGEPHFAETARFWQSFFADDVRDFEALGCDIVGGFRELADRGQIEIITCAATHGYMPLLGTDESVRAQVRMAVLTHTRHLGRAPKGIWVPECGYRPAGRWAYPVPPAEALPLAGPFDRVGVEEVLGESGLEFFFVDTHLVEESAGIASPYGFAGSGSTPASLDEDLPSANNSRIYHPYFVESAGKTPSGVTVFPRDPNTGLQVWSADSGYPGDAHYLDFHKKRWPGGHRYWRVTGAGVDMGEKEPYDPARAAAKVRDHAAHFVHLVHQTLQPSFGNDVPPVLCSPFDAELFGHWWFEGPLWLEAVARALGEHETGVALITGSGYLARFPRAGSLSMREGAWGAEGTNQVWLNPDTEWTYSRLYAAEIRCRSICSSPAWQDGALGERIAKQLCRELLLLESSDWQFLITTGAARDYAELRFGTHHDQFNALSALWEEFAAGDRVSGDGLERLAAIELRDGVFPDIDPAFWAAGARDSGTVQPKPVASLSSLALGSVAGVSSLPSSLEPSSLPSSLDDGSLSESQKFHPSTYP